MESLNLSALVLAAGRSCRMGGEHKLLLPWGKGRLVQAAVEAVCSVPFAEVLVVIGHRHQEVEALLEDYPVRLVPNPCHAEGLSSSVRAGVQAAGQTRGYLFALGDMPAVRSHTLLEVGRALERGGEEAIAVPVFQGQRGNPVAIGRAYREELLALEGDRGARPILHQHAHRVIEVPVEDAGIFADIDTPEMYRQLRPQRRRAK
jgi:molybdenum cofactor cytidylyltransferase